MNLRRTALLGAATLVLGAGLYGATVLPASGDPAGRSAATSGWAAPRVASVVEAERVLAAQAGPASETLVLYAVQTDSYDVDLPPRGFSFGDFFLFEENLFSDRALTDQVGRDAARGEEGITNLTYEATFELADGKITAAGSWFLDRAVVTLAITGGTGDYRGVGGTFAPFTLPDGTTVLVFSIVR